MKIPDFHISPGNGGTGPESLTKTPLDYQRVSTFKSAIQPRSFFIGYKLWQK